MTDEQRERYDEARNEARQDEYERCPCCDSLLCGITRFRDEGRIVEQGVSCQCGYASGTSYGQNYLELPDGWRENDQGEIVNEDDEIVLEEIE